MDKMTRFVVKSYFDKDDKSRRKNALAKYFFTIFYRSIMPLFSFFMAYYFWETIIFRWALIAFGAFFVFFQFEVDFQ